MCTLIKEDVHIDRRRRFEALLGARQSLFGKLEISTHGTAAQCGMGIPRTGCVINLLVADTVA